MARFGAIAAPSLQPGGGHFDFSGPMIVGAAIYGLMMLVLAWALLQARRRATPTDADAAPEPIFDRAVARWTGLVALGLVTLIAAGFLIDATLARAAPRPLIVKVTGHRWWWRIEYPGEGPGGGAPPVVTANELHLPAGRPVQLELGARDVIHSFWVPNLHGRIDLIAGRNSEVVITPRKVGVYHGQCAEFCGLEHARMALHVFVDPPSRFAEWRRWQASPASGAPRGNAALGAAIVERGPCADCHRVAGTAAAGQAAPDLTHLASRTTIASGAAPRTRANLLGWIRDPQQFKPGAGMPAVRLTERQRAAVVDYLETLK